MALLPRLLLAALLSTVATVQAEDARISWLPEAPSWQLDSLMHLQLTAPETEALHLTYSVHPLTAAAGLNQSEAFRSVSLESCPCQGNIIGANSPLRLSGFVGV